jgi:hypothetical protein
MGLIAAGGANTKLCYAINQHTYMMVQCMTMQIALQALLPTRISAMDIWSQAVGF